MKIRLTRANLLEHRASWIGMAKEFINSSEEEFMDMATSGDLGEAIDEFIQGLSALRGMLTIGELDIDPQKVDITFDKIVAVVGKSGSGKSSIIRGVEDILDINVIKSKTTRKVREYDPEDADTHYFVTQETYEQEKDTAVAMYNSPKGYHSWISPGMITSGRVNIYAIDPVAIEEHLIPYCRANSIQLEIVYIDIDEKTRKNRIEQRGCDHKEYSEEAHLAKHHLKHPHWVITNNGTIEEAVKQLVGIVEELNNGSNTGR